MKWFWTISSLGAHVRSVKRKVYFLSAAIVCLWSIRLLSITNVFSFLIEGWTAGMPYFWIHHSSHAINRCWQFDYSIIWNVTPIASTTTREVLRARASTCVQGQERRHRQGGPGVLRQAAALHQVKNARLTQLCICVHHDISCIEAGKYNIYVKWL